MRHKTRKNKKNGGELIGVGAYGCVFSPPLLCARKTQTLKNKVGKIVEFLPEAEAEYTIAKKLMGFSNWTEYFILPESICKLGTRKKQTNTNVQHCPLLEGNKAIGEYAMMIMEKGNSFLDPSKQTPTTFYSFAKRLIAANAILQTFHIVHRDLHAYNILVDNNNNAKIIDFGIAVDIDKVLTIDQFLHEPGFQFVQESPEMCLITVLTLLDITPTQAIKQLQQTRRFSESAIKELTKFIREKTQLFSNRDILSMFHTYWDKQDSWAIGIELTRILKYLNKSKVDPTLLKIIRKMIEVDPRKRLSGIEALNRLTSKKVY